MTETIKSGWSSTRRRTTRRRLAGIGLLLALAATLVTVVVAAPASATHVTPDLVSGNPSCASEFGGDFLFSYKLEPVADTFNIPLSFGV